MPRSAVPGKHTPWSVPERKIWFIWPASRCTDPHPEVIPCPLEKVKGFPETKNTGSNRCFFYAESLQKKRPAPDKGPDVLYHMGFYFRTAFSKRLYHSCARVVFLGTPSPASYIMEILFIAEASPSFAARLNHSMALR